MTRTIQRFSFGHSILFAQGKFDEYCVYIRKPDDVLDPPHDLSYFQYMLKMNRPGVTTERQNHRMTFMDFIAIYEMTGKAISENVLEKIHVLASSYNDPHWVELTFVVLYAAMVAEENKENTKLDKKIKGLAVYMLLIENRSPEFIVNYFQGMKWQKIQAMCDARHLFP